MEKYWVYIIYSKQLDRFYTGATSLLPDERLYQHTNGFYGDKKFTAKASDWILYHTIECSSRIQSIKIESHIKKMKSKKYIQNLKIYPEITNKLLKKY